MGRPNTMAKNGLAKIGLAKVGLKPFSLPLYTFSCGIRPKSRFLSFQTLINVSFLVIFSIVCMVHDEFFTHKRKDCIDVVHQFLTLHLRRNIFALKYQNVLPEGLVCRLHSLFCSIVRCPLTIHSTTQYLDGKCVASTCLSTTNLLVSRSHLLASSIRSRDICSKISFECDMIQKMSAHIKQHV